MAETSAFFAKTDCESSLGDAFKPGNPGDSCVRWTMALIFKSIKHLAPIENSRYFARRRTYKQACSLARGSCRFANSSAKEFSMSGINSLSASMRKLISMARADLCRPARTFVRVNNGVRLVRHSQQLRLVSHHEFVAELAESDPNGDPVGAGDRGTVWRFNQLPNSNQERRGPDASGQRHHC